MNKFEFKNLTPFKWFVLENFPFIEADFDALTEWQLFCKIGKEMNKIINSENILGTQMENVTNAFIELQNYVTNYFDNLDVQDEINNKLNEMAESGELQEIITAYLQVNGILAFNNIEEMKISTNLLNGSFAETYGFYEKNDGGNAKYKIRAIAENETPDEITVISLQNDLVAELIITNEMNIKQFGAKGDGTQDDTTYIQKAIDNVKKLFIPPTVNYYKVTDNLELISNQVIYGVGENSKILMPNNLVKTIFDIQNVNNIIIDNIKLCNESCQTGSTPDTAKNILIYSENVQNLSIQNCFFENAYSRGIKIKRTKNFNYINNKFKNASIDMLLLLQEVENVLVDNSIFDTILSSYINTYLFATGREDTETYNFSCRNIIVQNSKFLNNPNWEGIDTHACNGFTAKNNYIENCKVGIMASIGSTAPITSEDIKMSNLLIENNIVKCSQVGSSRYGITVGVAPQTLIKFCENVNIINNKIYDFSEQNSIGAIELRGIKQFNVDSNYIYNSNSGINITCCYNGKIKNNIILENDTYGINCIAGSWFIDIVNNTIKNLIKSNMTRAIRSSSYLCILNIENNDLQGATQLYGLTGTNMLGIINANTTQIGKIGNYVKNQYGLITHYNKDSAVHPAKSETLSFVSISGNSDTKIFTGTNAMYYLCPGEEITIPGAGLGGLDLTTTITDFITRDTFSVKDTILISVENVHPSVTAGTWEEV